MSKTIVKGKKIILRPLKISDAERFCQWLGDPEVTKFLSIHDLPKPTVKEEKEWIRNSRKDKKSFRLAIDTIEGTHIGSTSLQQIDKFDKRAEFGVMIGDKKYWGQGCGTEVCKLMVDYGFKKMKLHRIHLTYIAFNIRGQKAYEKVGFKIEGRSRDHIFRDGHWHDEVQMGLLREEYLKGSRK